MAFSLILTLKECISKLELKRVKYKVYLPTCAFAMSALTVALSCDNTFDVFSPYLHPIRNTITPHRESFL